MLLLSMVSLRPFEGVLSLRQRRVRRVQELRLWPLCIKLMRFTQYDNGSDIEKAWDLLLKDAVESCGAPATAPRLKAACAQVQELSRDAYGTVWCDACSTCLPQFDGF